MAGPAPVESAVLARSRLGSALPFWHAWVFLEDPEHRIGAQAGQGDRESGHQQEDHQDRGSVLHDQHLFQEESREALSNKSIFC